MRSYFQLLLVMLLGSAILIGCSRNKVTKIGQAGDQTPSTPTTYADGAPRITIVELQQKIKDNKVFIVDVRDQASFDAGHLPGSKLIPAAQILNHLDELPKNKLIVTYCS
ncbi:MAG TPA: rhodanese-like domain-containing protein [Pyrinomonadaceae bacterium]|jgi:Rhodanese-related sulfurtransferase|nr:rhodanese-like domain-containing protein [Pyrinomonadaceae bacterium]